MTILETMATSVCEDGSCRTKCLRGGKCVAMATMRAAMETAKAAGYVLVPVEPTEGMRRAAYRPTVTEHGEPYESSFTDGEIDAVWGAMLSAAPDVTKDAG